MKQLSTVERGTSFAIAYAKLIDFDDHDALLAEVRKSLQGAGATPVKVQDVVVGGRDGVEEVLEVPPETKLNPSKSKMTARVRVLLDSDRAYVLIGIEPARTTDSWLPRYFDSFEFAAAREAEVLP